MQIVVAIPQHEYEIEIDRGLLEKVRDLCDLDRKVLIVTDSGVPKEYADTVASRCREAVIETIPQGELSKSLECFSHLEKVMLAHDFTRKDCAVALGGGVVGDLTGFAAACYMRGIDFYNIPTTVLSQVDSSIGGKTAVNFEGVKNIIGAFYQPKKVIIDLNVLRTLPKRQIANGMAEAVKMAATFDAALFEKFEKAEELSDLYPLIADAIGLKRVVVEQDEKETGLRKVLNFGHTLGHGVEAACIGKLLHGECVALGMLPMSSAPVRERLMKIYDRIGLPVRYDFDMETAMDAIRHDKKGNGDTVTAVLVNTVGQYEMLDMTMGELETRLAMIRGEA
ncbi:MAG: 3-dehydroquinate synthase [Lachnospiraceae bacterium]|nr:3-dehydroquinate synthase [Lachnospiraceae bacterium]